MKRIAVLLALLAPSAAFAMPAAIASAISYIGASMVMYGGSAFGAALLGAATFLGYAITFGGLALYSNYQRRKAESRARSAYNASLKDRTLMVRSTTEPRDLVLGRVRKSGPLVFVGTTGQHKEKLVMVIALAAHRCSAIEQVYFNDQPVTLDANGYVQSAPYVRNRRVSASVRQLRLDANGTGVFNAPGPVIWAYTGGVNDTFNLSWAGNVITVTNGQPFGVIGLSYQYEAYESKARVWWYLGDENQAADARLKQLFPDKWTDAHRLRGITYLVAELDYNEDAFPSSIPNISAVVRGALVYDPRDGQTKWSQNPALLARHYAYHPLGAGLPAGSVSDSHVIAAANACDVSQSVTVSLPSGGSQTVTLPLYQANTVAKSGSKPSDVLQELAEAMAGKVGYQGNQLVMRAGAYTAPVMALDDNDFSDASAIEIAPHRPRDQVINRVTGTFADQDNNWQVVDFPAVQFPDYIAQDGRELPIEVELGAVTHVAQAQHVCRVMLRDARQSLIVKASFKLKAYPLQLFDVVTITCARYGWVAKPFEVLGRRWALGSIELTLKETDPSIYSVDPNFSGINAAPNTSLPKPWEVADVGPLVVESGTSWLVRQSDGTVLTRVRVTWPAIQDAPVQNGGVIEVAYTPADDPAADGKWPFVQVPGDSTEAFITGLEDGRVYLIKARARSSIAAGQWSVQVSHRVVGKLAPPSNVTSIEYAFEEFGVRLSWPAVPDADVQEYELRQGSGTWERAQPLTGQRTVVRATSFLWRVLLSGTTTVQIKAIDTSGNYSQAAATVAVSVPVPAQVSLAGTIEGAEEVLTWSPPISSAFAIDRYEIRQGSTWASAALVDTTKATFYRRAITYSGRRNYWVSAIDAAGNYGTPAMVSIDVYAPGPVTSARAEVIDNNVLLYWSAPTSGSLPIASYEVRKGASWATGASVGSNGNSTFTPVFEQQGGPVTYWVAAFDSAGNMGTPVSIQATVNQPPDYILRSNIDSAFGGTKTNLVVENGSLVGPVNTSETWAQHFESRGWTSIQQQIDAGYPLYAMPSLTTAAYEEVLDYGSPVPPTVITTTLNRTVVAGAVSVSARISYKLNAGDAWIDGPVGAESVLASNFRYVKVRYDFTASGGDDLIRVHGLNIKLSVKLKTDNGSGTANAADAGGTTVTFNVPFVDVESINVTPSGTAARYAVYDFADSPNPTSFKVLLYDVNGNRVSGGFSWTARGY